MSAAGGVFVVGKLVIGKAAILNMAWLVEAISLRLNRSKPVYPTANFYCRP